MEPALSVVIPTYKRPAILAQCLEHLEKQTLREHLEVIVVSDGADTETERIVKEKPWKMPVRYEAIEKSQQGAARNRGVQMALAPLILFIGDDTLLSPQACEKHVESHGGEEERNQKSEGRRENGTPHSALPTPHSHAVLGFTTWDPEVGITDVMKWLEESGWQFGYPKIAEYAHDYLPEDIQHRFTYTSNISVPKDIVESLPFMKTTLYGWEDIEWGMRLKNAGIRVFYEPDASALHHHKLTIEDSLRRMETLGRSAGEMERLLPHLRLVPRGGKRLAYRLSALLPTMDGKHRKAFLQGLQKKERIV